MSRILVVDDDDAIRESIRLALNTVGLDTVLCESGERALEAMAHTSFDGAIVDLMMPGMDGIETISALRARVPGLPIVVVSGSLHSGSATTNLLRMASELPGVTGLAKPFKLSDLLRAVHAALAANQDLSAPKPAA